MNNRDQDDWERCKAKGAKGEEIIDRIMKDLGWSRWTPPDDCAHEFDRFYRKRGGTETEWQFAEVKCYPLRRLLADSGIHENHWNEYLNASKSLGGRLFIYFVDEEACAVYGNWVDELAKDRYAYGRWYPLHENTVENGRKVYFPWTAFIQIDKLTPVQAAAIAEYRKSRFAARGSSRHNVNQLSGL